jgi:hypothetical protein
MTLNMFGKAIDKTFVTLVVMVAMAAPIVTIVTMMRPLAQ